MGVLKRGLRMGRSRDDEILSKNMRDNTRVLLIEFLVKGETSRGDRDPRSVFSRALSNKGPMKQLDNQTCFPADGEKTFQQVVTQLLAESKEFFEQETAAASKES